MMERIENPDIRETVKDVEIAARRGYGASSLWTRKPAIGDYARDMRALLDALGGEEQLDVLGLSTGGPIALTLAYLDDGGTNRNVDE